MDPGEYARWRVTPLGAATERLEMQQVFELAGPLAHEAVLDVGTGDGTYALEAASRGAEVTGVDTDPMMLRAAQERAASRRISVTFANGHVEALPFDDATFDLVLAVTVLCFVEDTATAFREMARVLRPGGRLVVGELGRHSPWAALRRVRGWFGSRTWRVAHFWSRAELRRQMTGAGLRVVAVRGAIHFPPIALAARMLAPIDPWLSSVRAPGAAFLVVSADKPNEGS
jgi:ubiquinone/menaquinone biosynthesis C-methylase UbiE